MKTTPRRWFRLGALFLGAVWVLMLYVATACIESTAPKYPQNDSTKTDTVRTSLLATPGADQRV